ncbi:MAG TPA: hypothetical protein VJY35_15710 [Candidatus Eisenbacteria bacterium]|nr:hypothetical protein [Candidatus Eisenbacteria bacterium]
MERRTNRIPMSGVFAQLVMLLTAGLVLSGCGTRGEAPRAQATRLTTPADLVATDLAAAAVELESASDMLLELPGVVGVGLARGPSGAPVALVLAERARIAGVPLRVGTLDVQTEVVGPIRAFALTDRYRPVPIGVSAGNAIDCLPGTIGCVVNAGGRQCLLSANHVFARQNQAQIGEAITQPSLPDADPTCTQAPPPTVVARLTDYQPVVYDGHTPNRFDAAIAELIDGSSCATLPAFYGQPSSQPSPPLLHAPILKVGRTTELTRGSIKAIDVKVKITFPAGTALFVGQILTTKQFGAFGDSGSLIVTDDGAYHPVGIVIGGGSNGTAIASPIGPILERFGASVCGR